MKHDRFSKEKILPILREQDSGKMADAYCKHDMSNAAFYKWKATYTHSFVLGCCDGKAMSYVATMGASTEDVHDLMVAIASTTSTE